MALPISNLNQRLQLTLQYATLESKQVKFLGCRYLPDFTKDKLAQSFEEH